MAKANPLRFSTKYQDDETDLLYYGYRYYLSSIGRWVSRDPVGEIGDRNVLAFVRNNPLGAYDQDGRITVTTLTKKPITVCGSFDVKWNFVVDKAPESDGYIVQKVTFEWDYVDEYDDPIAARHVKKTKTYWEAWLVKGGKTEPTTQSAAGYTDYASEPGHRRAKGTITSSGEIKFFLVKHPTGNLGDPGANPSVPPDPSSGWKAGNGVDWSGILPYTETPPSWWKHSPDNGESAASRSVTTTWECTCSKFSMAMSESISVTP